MKGKISNEKFNMNERDLNPNQMCQLYACMAWNGMTYDDAKKLVTEKSYEEVDQVTYTNSSIETAKAGIEKYEKELKSDKKFYAVMKILEEIHDKWVSENAKKYDRDGIAQNPDLPQEKVDKRLFQHMPTALIGLEELAKDAMFLEPFLHEKGIEIGKMTNEPYGAFVPNKELSNVYETYVNVFKEKNNIKEITPAKIKEVIKDYVPLQENTSELGKARLEYMNERTEILAKQIEKNNPQQFLYKEHEEKKTIERIQKANFSQMTNEELEKYVKFSLDQERSFYANKVLGDLVPTAGAELSDAIGAAQEFLARQPIIKDIDLVFNDIHLNINGKASVEELEKQYEKEWNNRKKENLKINKLENTNDLIKQ